MGATRGREALNHEIKGKRVKVLPLLKRRCNIPAFLNGKIYADFSRASQYSQSLARLVSAMGLDPGNKGRVPGSKMIRVRDFREKIASHFAPRKVDIEFFDDDGGLVGITVWNEDKTFELYSWETMPTDMELLSQIFYPDGSSQVKEIATIEGGPFPLAEQDQVIAELQTMHSLPADMPLHK